MNKGRYEISILINLTIDSVDETTITFSYLIKIESYLPEMINKYIPIFVWNDGQQ